MSGKTDIELFPKSEAEENTKIDQNVLEQKEKVVSRQMYIPGTRKKKWGLVTKVPILNHEGVAEGMLCTIKDITEEKKANELNEELRSAISNIQDVVWTGTMADYKFKYTTVNEATQNLLGMTQTQFFKDEWKKHVHPDFWEDVEKYSSDTKSNPIQVEYKYIHPITKRSLWLQNRTNIDGQHYFGIIRDITEEKSIEKTKILEDALNKINVGISLYDPKEDKCIYTNKAVAGLYGIDDEKFKTPGLAGQCLNLRQLKKKSKKSGAVRRKESISSKKQDRIVHKEKGIRWLETYQNKQDYKDKTTILNITKDITEQKEQQAEKEIIINALNFSEDAIWLVETDIDGNKGKYIFINNARENLYELGIKTMYKNQDFFMAYYHPEDKERIFDFCKKNIDGNLKLYYRLMFPDKRIKFIEEFVFASKINTKKYSGGIQRLISEDTFNLMHKKDYIRFS